MSTYTKMDETREKIYEYLQYDGSDEFTQLCEALCNLVSHTSVASDEFTEALLKELDECLKVYQENTEIVETEETTTIKTKTVEWIL